MFGRRRRSWKRIATKAAFQMQYIFDDISDVLAQPLPVDVHEKLHKINEGLLDNGWVRDKWDREQA